MVGAYFLNMTAYIFKGSNGHLQLSMDYPYIDMDGDPYVRSGKRNTMSLSKEYAERIGITVKKGEVVGVEIIPASNLLI